MHFLLALMLIGSFANARDLSIPDLELTPGVATKLTVEEICATKWGTDRRHVTASMKREVFHRYGLKGNSDKACIPDRHGRRCEIDHAWSREIGGADDLLNLSPQPYGGRWGAVLKDRLENRLHKELCAGNITLDDARNALLPDWRIAYKRYFK